MKINPIDLDVVIIHDKPKSGMWHCGPNPCWVEVTHLPTMCSVRAYSGDDSHYKTRRRAETLLDIMLEDMRDTSPCSFPENVKRIKDV